MERAQFDVGLVILSLQCRTLRMLGTWTQREECNRQQVRSYPYLPRTIYSYSSLPPLLPITSFLTVTHPCPTDGTPAIYQCAVRDTLNLKTPDTLTTSKGKQLNSRHSVPKIMALMPTADKYQSRTQRQGGP